MYAASEPSTIRQITVSTVMIALFSAARPMFGLPL
jgi:hypothetical protein